MSRINLTNLETVCCIARAGTFSAASERLNASQPAVTARVREIESATGITFFQKRGRRMELTVQGRQFIDRVEPLMLEMEEALLTHSDASVLNGVVRIGVGAVTMIWFSDLVGELKREMPQVDYELDISMGMTMIGKLESGRLDLAIVAGKQVRIPGMVSIDLRPSQLQWVMSSRVQRVVGGRELPLGELLDSAPIWLMPRQSILFSQAIDVARRHGAQLRNISTCSNMMGLVDLIDKGGGIGIVATETAKDRLADGSLVPVSDKLKPQTLELTLLFHDDLHQSLVRRVADRIAEADARRSSLSERLRLRPTRARKNSEPASPAGLRHAAASR